MRDVVKTGGVFYSADQFSSCVGIYEDVSTMQTLVLIVKVCCATRKSQIDGKTTVPLRVILSSAQSEQTN